MSSTDDTSLEYCKTPPSEPLRISVPGKCILTGEHAVLRGFPALVLPFENCRLELQYHEGPQTEARQIKSGDNSELVFWGVLEKALQAVGRSRTDVKGRFQVRSSVPVGAGLGASAALCAGVTRWITAQGWLIEAEELEFARSLENLFHGESSGVDVAVALRGVPLRFVRGQAPQTLELQWRPELYISYSGQRGITAECVAQVQKLLETQPRLGAEIDSQMGESVDLIEKALVHSGVTTSERIRMFAEGIYLARSCFSRWGLMEGMLEAHVHKLEAVGALAVKPTGSGGGGHVLSLWKRTPDPEVISKYQLMKVWS